MNGVRAKDPRVMTVVQEWPGGRRGGIGGILGEVRGKKRNLWRQGTRGQRRYPARGWDESIQC